MRSSGQYTIPSIAAEGAKILGTQRASLIHNFHSVNVQVKGSV